MVCIGKCVGALRMYRGGFGNSRCFGGREWLLYSVGLKLMWWFLDYVFIFKVFGVLYIRHGLVHWLWMTAHKEQHGVN